MPGVYKNIEDVMREQQDLVEMIAQFDPKIVKMCGDGSQAGMTGRWMNRDSLVAPTPMMKN